MKPFLLVFLTLILSGGAFGQEERVLFDGVSMDHWQVIDSDGHGAVCLDDSCLIIEKGEFISGVRWTSEFPTTNYEITLQAKRIEGHDFFCGLTFPVKDSFVTLILGGWGGTLCGLSCIDGYDAANNFTSKIFYFGTGAWWPVRVRVTDNRIEAWVDEDKIVDFPIGRSRFSLRLEVENSAPFGVTTYQTTGAIRDMKLRRISE
jgi:hypothetical protein